MTCGYGELEHRYGPRVHILDNPLLATALAHLSSPKVSHAELMGHLRMIYRSSLGRWNSGPQGASCCLPLPWG